MAEAHLPRAVTFGLLLSGAFLCLLNAYSLRQDTDLARLHLARRYWEDVNGAIRMYRGQADDPEPPPPATSSYGRAHTHAWRATQRVIAERAAAAHIRVVELWRTVSVEGLAPRPALYPVRSYEDKGRAWLLWIGFTLLGGVSPFLLLWLGALFFVPVLLWSGIELFRYGRPCGAAALLLLCGLSPFVAGLVTLPHSGMGFYLAAVVAAAGLAAYAVLGTVSAAGLARRALVLGLLFALCVRCRGTAVCTLTGFLLALAIGAHRATRGRSRIRSLGLFVAVAALFVAPHAVVRDTTPRPAWFGLWMGLGDFDRSHRHVWDDQVAERAYERAGHELGPSDFWRTGPGSEPFYRRVVLDHIREDPGWFASILAKRLWATVAMPKLWPRAARDGVSITPARSVNEGKMDRYYAFAPTVDRIGLGHFNVEMPLLVLVGPSFMLVLLALLQLGRRVLPWAPAGAPASVLLVSCPALSALTCPVVISTASAPETQALALVHFICAGLLADCLFSWRPSRRSPTPAAHTG